MSDATRFEETDATLIPSTEGSYGTVDDGLRQDPEAPQRPSLRRAVREDVSHARDYARTRAIAARQAVVEDPLRSAFTALGVGVIIGMMLRR